IQLNAALSIQAKPRVEFLAGALALKALEESCLAVPDKLARNVRRNLLPGNPPPDDECAVPVPARVGFLVHLYLLPAHRAVTEILVNTRTRVDVRDVAVIRGVMDDLTGEGLDLPHEFLAGHLAFPDGGKLHFPLRRKFRGLQQFMAESLDQRNALVGGIKGPAASQQV